jgi:putative PIN family toxin of toxin-antitoxin system
VRCVLDTNVIVTAMRSPAGTSAALLTAARHSALTLFCTVALALEYEATCRLAEHRAAAGLSLEQTMVFIDAVLAMVEPVEPHFLWRPQLRDPADEFVLETAINGRAEAIVTFNPPGFWCRARTPRDRGSDARRNDAEDRDMKRHSTYPLRLPHSLKAEVERLAKQDGISINQFIAIAVAEKLSAMRTAEFFAERRARTDFAEFDRLMRRQGGEEPGPDDTVA